MKITYGSERWIASSRPVMMTLGNFDGVHRGHQLIFKTLVEAARREKSLSLVYTFDPHPVKVLSPDSPFTLLQTTDQKLETIAAHCIDHVVVEPFTLDFAHLHARDFFKTIAGRIHPRHIYVGYDFTFGLHREGDVHLLYELGIQHGVTVTVIPAQFDGETLLSSSAVRQRMRSGDVNAAMALLGRPYVLAGTIVAGRGLGRQLGFPTANLATINECLPAPGIYATRLGCDRRSEPAVTYVGTNPTLGVTELAIETHVLTPVSEMLGKSAEVHFLRRIRGEEKFANREALAVRIAQDCQEALAYHAQNK